MGKATLDLRKEHDAILRVLKILDKMISDPMGDTNKLQYYSEVVYFLKVFADKCHHGKEETYLFEELVNRGIPKEGGPIGVMLREHQQGREYIALMDKSLEAKDLTEFNTSAAKYHDLLRQHIEKENNVLFVMADKVLNEAKQDELFRKFEQHEENVIGHGVHEKLHAMIHAWATEFNVN
ncbi:MAG: Hemerythrin HHE cation binding domain protein [Pelotomaculum sp. PtaB.Bin104]|nr:MAG: Hemerythrin HHE cation binding domain protein [Pelotomaculum sp. PtaB.Bin104]